jgi:glycosyltransferase involved in cell wall biosynthesis
MNQNLLLKAASFAPRSLAFPNAWVGHLPFASWVIHTTNPRVFVELGTHSGNSYFSFCQSVAESNLSTKCYAVDTWQGDEHAGHYKDDVFNEVNAHNEEHYAKFSRLMRTTFDEAVVTFPDASIDLLHIDGLHTYEAVRHDFETWLPKLAPGAIVLFHDTNVHERNFGVWKFWKELQKNYPNNLEFHHSHGLGVLQLSDAPIEKKMLWLQPDSAEKQKVIDYFTALGANQTTAYELIELRAHLADLNSALADREHQITTLSSEVTSLNATMAGLSGQIAALHNSSSWRVTSPLRFAARGAKRAFYVGRAILPAVQRNGGVQRMVRKALNLYRREGLPGIKRGFIALASQGYPNAGSGSGGFDRNDYSEWVRRFDTINDEGRNIIRSKIDTLDRKPLISVLMPTYNSNPDWLRQAIESVRQQIYPHWELCIADDASTDKAIRPILEDYAALDPRIKVVFREQNGHISAASNSALELVTGEWVALLDHDDLLAEHALFWVVHAINNRLHAKLIYSDEDKIDQSGRRFAPYFKCDWNVDLFYAHNMICHLGVYKTDLIRSIGGFRVGFEGSQDYDLALRCIEQIKDDEIHHIPRVLYHWRMHEASTASSVGVKPYASRAGEKALAEHFERRHIQAAVELTAPHMRRVRYMLPKDPPLVSLIIPTRNGLQLIRQCLTSILQKTAYPNYEVIIVDNGSDDPATIRYFESLQTDARVHILRDDRPFNYSALNNGAVKTAKGEVIGLLNNDLEVISPEWLSEMVSIVLQPGVGAVGARLWYPDKTLQHGGVVLGLGGVAGHSHKHLPHYSYGYACRAVATQSFSAVTAACLLIRKSVYEEVGGLNERDLSVAFNDVDFCLRVKGTGYRNVWTPYAELYHHESATRGLEDTPEKQARFTKEIHYMKRRWSGLLQNDPAYSPNLTLDYEDFSLAWPPRVESLASSGSLGASSRQRSLSASLS